MRLARPIESQVRISWTFQGPTHRGLDLSAYAGTPVYAPVTGTAYRGSQPIAISESLRVEPPTML